MSSRSGAQATQDEDRTIESDRNSELHAQRFERSDVVLWSLAPGGIILHHVIRGLYLELDEMGYRVWAFLDGAHSCAQIVARCASQAPEGQGEQEILAIIEALALNGYVEPYSHD